MNVFWGEFIGTMLLILLGNGAVANVVLKHSKGHNSGWIVITAGWGFAVAMAAYVAGWISGAHINPVITIAWALLGKTTWSVVPCYIIAQLLGAMTGALLVWLAYYPLWHMTDDDHSKLACFATIPAVRNLKWNFITETIATFTLVLAVLAITDSHNQIQSGMMPYLVGILVFSIGLSLGGLTGYAINPARDLGPRIVFFFLPLSKERMFDWGYAWVPILGPIAGAIIASYTYQLFFGLTP